MTMPWEQVERLRVELKKALLVADLLRDMIRANDDPAERADVAELLTKRLAAVIEATPPALREEMCDELAAGGQA